MKRFVASLLIVQLLARSGVALAYGVPTHQRLSEEAVKASVLQTDSNVLPDLGLEPLSDEQTFPSPEQTLRSPRTILQLIQDGTAFEDNLLTLRFRHHFYDPIHRRPLTVGGIAVGEASPDWALEDTRDIAEQYASFKDARKAFYNALTEPNKRTRDFYFGATFHTLGAVIHHLQDMAQPQHVRNDQHALGSRYEKYTNDVRGSLSFAGYDSVHFDTARKFWVTDEAGGTGQGIAEFTNNNFVSIGTNFTGSLNPRITAVGEAPQG